MSELGDKNYEQLFVALANGDEVLLDAAVRGQGGKEVTLTMTNGQTVADCFWVDEVSQEAKTNESRVRKLIRFVHDRNRPAYYRALDALRPYLPQWIVKMNGYTMMAFYVGLVVVAWLLYYSFGRGALPFLFPLTLFVVAITLGFDEPDMEVDIDYNTLEDTAHTMLGRPPKGSVRVPKPE
jgi:hypothetical protein